jgi:hypothetical protein
MSSPEASKPILAMDVDGVISIFGFDELPEDLPARFELIDGLVRCIPEGAGERLRRLGEHFELVWATGWEVSANRLSALLDLPEYPYLTFGGKARFGTADWKLEPLEEYGRGRPLAWVDDSFDERCRAWAAAREEPTLLVATEARLGLEESHEEELREWALALAERA